MPDVTQILSQIESDDPSAAEQLLPLEYEEVRKLAATKFAVLIRAAADGFGYTG